MRHATIIIILALVSGVVYWFSANTPWLIDDFVYQYHIAENGDVITDRLDLKPIDSANDILVSQVNHYFTTNGRALDHILVQGFCGIWGHMAFALFNVIAYLLFFRLIALVAGVSFRNVGSVATIVILTFLSYQTLMTPSCQIGYIWMGDIILCFIYVFRSCEFKSKLMLPLLFLFSFIAGSSHDAYVVGTGCALIIYWFRNLRSLSPARWVMIVGFGIGGLFLCLAPGTVMRASGVKLGGVEAALTALLSLKCMIMMLAVVAYKCLTAKESLKSIYAGNAFFINALVFSLMLTLLFGVVSGRQFFGAELFSIIIMMRLLVDGRFKPFWMSVLGAAVVLFAVDQLVKLDELNRDLLSVEEQYRDSADGTVYVDTETTKFYGFLDYVPFVAAPNLLPNYSQRALINLMALKYPEHDKRLTILPMALKGKTGADIGNAVFSIDGNAKRVYVQSDSAPARFIIHRYLFGLVPVSPVEVDFSNPVIDTGLWRAVVKDDQSPLITYGSVDIIDQPHEKDR